MNNEAISKLEELAGKIYSLNDELALEHSRSLSGNKAAATRARKHTLELEKLCKEYRKVSLEMAKK